MEDYDMPIAGDTILQSTEIIDDHMDTDQNQNHSHQSEWGITRDAVAAAVSNVAGLVKEHRSRISTSPTKRERDLSNGKAQVRVAVQVNPPKFLPLPYTTARTGLVYDVRMRFHHCLESVQDPSEEPHPEQPRRIFEIYNELFEAGLVWDPKNPSDNSDFQLLRIPTRHATLPELLLVHSEKHVRFVESLTQWTINELLNEKMDSVYLHNMSYFCATLSAGGAIEAARAVVGGAVRNAVAVIRPPGHHAEHDEPSGFCFFNNVPIAARVVQQDFPSCRKILILDWDVHHGNGVQRTFYDDPNVLYISLHVHMDGRFYPPTTYGAHYMVGEGAGIGRNVNIPWFTPGMTDSDYILAFQQIVMPIATEFDPDLVMISAGFDAAAGDPLGECYVSPAGFAHMTHMLMQLAKGKVVACLEGGYNLRSIATSALAMTRTLMGEPPDRLDSIDPTPSGIATVQQVIKTQSKYWKCMYPKEMQLVARKELGSERLHDVLRDYQSKTLWEKYSMSPLMILRSELSKSLKDQVLTTPNFQERRPLLLVFHDPPHADTLAEPGSSKVELHNILITDYAKDYIGWAIKAEFAVLDIGIPKHLTTTQDTFQREEAEKDVARRKLAQDTASYLWENYVEVGCSDDIFILTMGEASHCGVLDWLKTNPSIVQDISGIYSIVSEHGLNSLSDPEDPSVATSYYHKSLVFVSRDHAAANPDRKIKKKFGNLRVSSEIHLQEMLHAHFPEVRARLEHETAKWHADFQASKVTNIDQLDDTDVEEDPATVELMPPRKKQRSTSRTASTTDERPAIEVALEDNLRQIGRTLPLDGSV